MALLNLQGLLSLFCTILCSQNDLMSFQVLLNKFEWTFKNLNVHTFVCAYLSCSNFCENFYLYFIC